jgi:hypothetical protein
MQIFVILCWICNDIMIIWRTQFHCGIAHCIKDSSTLIFSVCVNVLLSSIDRSKIVNNQLANDHEQHYTSFALVRCCGSLHQVMISKHVSDAISKAKSTMIAVVTAAVTILVHLERFVHTNIYTLSSLAAYKHVSSSTLYTLLCAAIAQSASTNKQCLPVQV